MCRFLLVQSKQPLQPAALLTEFAQRVKHSPALDGDWQGDGWGVSWVNAQGTWQVQKSLQPIWEDIKSFDALPTTQTFVAHARSASWPQHKGVIEFNQPYVYGEYAFVFNGLLKGVTLPNVPGRIGAEKIWYLLQRELNQTNPEQALANIKRLLLQQSKEIVALNIGLATPEQLYSVCLFNQHPEYYQLHYYNTPNLQVICSEALPSVRSLRVGR